MVAGNAFFRTAIPECDTNMNPGMLSLKMRRIAPDSRHDTATRELYALVVAPQHPSTASGSSSGDPTLRK